MRAAVAAAFVAALGSAPIQCKHDPDPNNRLEDTAGDGLWDLAEDFHAKGNEPARKETLRFLVKRYPANRHAAAARAELGEAPAPPAPAVRTDADAGR